MNIEESYEYINNVAKVGSIMGLERIKRLLDALGNPQDKLKVIHVAGTNGKGSILAYLEAGFKGAGLKCGRYTSPTLFSYLERFMIDDEEMSESDFAKYLTDVKEAADRLLEEGMEYPTAFEIETALAFYYFYKANVDVMLLETGMGGRDDATNVLKTPIATAFASISMDHMSFLGDTIEEIADNKAGIMRDKVPVIIAPMANEAKSVLITHADNHNSAIHEVTKEEATLIIRDGERYISVANAYYPVKLLGDFQADNAATAVRTMLAVKDILNVDIKAFSEGMKNVKWRGRFEVIGENPLVIRDGAHNPDAVKRLKKSIESLDVKGDIRFVIGIFKDKDYRQMLDIVIDLPVSIYTVTPPNEMRALKAEELSSAIEDVKRAKGVSTPDVIAVGDIKKGLDMAVGDSKADDLVVVFGSLSLSSKLGCQ